MYGAAKCVRRRTSIFGFLILDGWWDGGSGFGAALRQTVGNGFRAFRLVNHLAEAELLMRLEAAAASVFALAATRRVGAGVPCSHD